MITKFKEFTNEKLDNVLFSHGGNIGGPHQKPIKDKDFNPTTTGISSIGNSIDRQKKDERLINLMGSVLRGRYGTKNVEDIIKYAKEYKKKIIEYPNVNFNNSIDLLVIKNSFSEILDVAKHFDVDINSNDSIINFIENKLDLFERSYKMYCEIAYNYTSRYNESCFVGTGGDLEGLAKKLKPKIGHDFEIKNNKLYFLASEDEETEKELKSIAKKFNTKITLE